VAAPVHANAAKEWALRPGYQVDFLRLPVRFTENSGIIVGKLLIVLDSLRAGKLEVVNQH
jgi:hypothetical protein